MQNTVSTPRKSILFTDRSTGEHYKWSFWRDARIGWMLADPSGYVRTLERTWIESAPRIRAIAENYGCTVEVN